MATKENAIYSGNRYAYDMEQAEAMRGSQRRLRDDKKRPVTPEQVNLALRGLDEAESQRDKGDKERALRLYTIHLETLVSFLKDGELLKRTQVDASTVRERVLVALSDAEKLKGQPSENAESPTSQSSFVSGAISSIANKFLGRPRVTTNSDALSEEKAVAPVPTKTSPSTSPGSGKKQSVNSRPSKAQKGFSEIRRSDQMPSLSGASTSSIQPQSTGPHKTALRLGDSAKNKLYTAVLDDLYVDRESIQETSWDDIAGLEDAKQSLQESAILPLVRPDLFTGLRKPQNILLWGPPGTGKTMLVRAVAKESGSNLFACSASSLTSKWMGEAEKLVKALFQIAQEIAPSLIFLDEVDALLSSRKSDGEHEASRRLKTEFMIQMEGITSSENRVLVLACTNCPWDMDSAVLRRFPRRIFVPLPDAAARDALLQNLLKKAGKHSIKKKQRDALVQRLEGFSCSDITSIASEASFGPIRSLGGLAAVKGAKATDMRPVNSKDFEEAIRKATKSVSENQLSKFETWRREQSAL